MLYLYGMIVTSTDMQNNFGKYLELASSEEIVVTKKGAPVARLLGMGQTISFLSDSLVGLIPKDVDEKAAKEERMARQ
jgi:prevent-host-death family protein